MDRIPDLDSAPLLGGSRGPATPDPTTGAVAPPIHLSTTYERAADGSFPGGFTYIRPGNPTRAALEAALGALEGGEAAAFASGMAATMTAFQALEPGDRVIAPLDAYYGTPKLLRDHFARWGLRPVFADLSDLSALDQALREPTRLVWLETPSNPLIAITDIRGVGARQMQDFGGMLSAVLPGGRERAVAVAARLRLFTRATSLGGPESLVEHRASVEGPATRAPEGLLRFSIGLEHPEDLIEDLGQALAA